MKFTKCTGIPKLKFTKCTGIPKLMSINNCNLPRWRIPKMKFSPNWNQYQMMSTQRWEFFTVGQFQFGKISKWMNLNLVGNQFGSFTMGVNLKKVNINLEFVSERVIYMFSRFNALSQISAIHSKLWRLQNSVINMDGRSIHMRDFYSCGVSVWGRQPLATYDHHPLYSTNCCKQC